MGTPVYGTFLDGENMYQKELTNNGLLIMGNEGRAYATKWEQLVNADASISRPTPQERGGTGIAQCGGGYGNCLRRVPATGCKAIKSKGK